MSTLLHVSVSPRGDRSRSNQVGRTFVQAWQSAHPGGRVIIRDLALEPPTFVSAAWFEGAATPAADRSAGARSAMAESDFNIDQLFAADEVVITTPLFNFGVPAVLKAWIDQIVRNNRTFAIGPDGYRGLVPDRRVTVIVASGGDFRPGSPAFAFNHLEPYLRSIFGLIGLTTVEFIYASNQGADEDAARAGLEGAIAVARARAAA